MQYVMCDNVMCDGVRDDGVICDGVICGVCDSAARHAAAADPGEQRADAGCQRRADHSLHHTGPEL